MKFIIDQEVFELFPNYIVAVVVGDGLDNTGENAEISKELDKAVQEVVQKFPNETALADFSGVKVWREAFPKLGLNPKNYQSSIDAMLTRIVKKGTFPKINKLVDLSNSVALHNLVPIGAHDIGKLVGNIYIRFSKPGDIFTPMGATSPEQVVDKELVYADDAEVRTRKWVWRQGEKAKMFEDTTKVFFPIDGFSDVNYENVKSAQQQLNSFIREFTGGNAKTFFVDRNTPEVVL